MAQASRSTNARSGARKSSSGARKSSSGASSGSRSGSASSGSSSGDRSRSSSRQTRSRASGSQSRGRRTQASSQRSQQSRAAEQSSSSQGNGRMQSAVGSVGSVAKKAGTPLLAGGVAAAGLVGGAVLGSRFLRPRKKFLGIPLPRRSGGLQPLAKEVQKAGHQLGRLNDEVAQVRKQAQSLGKALTP